MNKEEHYIIYGHSALLTDIENKAVKNLNVLEQIKANDNPTMNRMMRERWIVKDPEVDKLLKDGAEVFFNRVVQRVKTEEIERLNTCPKCNTICRTIEACICPSCNYTWFEKRNETT